MLNVLIADDNAIEREFLRFLLKDIKDIRVVGEAEDGLQTLNLIETVNPDIVFLDINMPGLDGIRVVKEIASAQLKPFIVFVTVESKYAVQAFEFDTVDYLLKPFDRTRLVKTLKRIEERLASRAAMKKYKESKQIYVRDEDGDLVSINTKDIIFIEKDINKHTVIHTIQREYRNYQSLSSIEQELSSLSHFIRCHKSYLINIEKIAKVSRYGDGSYLVKFKGYKKFALVSRTHIRKFKDLIL